MASDSIDSRIRGLLGKKVAKGQEMHAFSQAQSELSNIQAQQASNLAEAKTIGGMEMAHNQDMAQVADLVSAGNFNQTTQGILSKYGLKPGNVSKKTSQSTTQGGNTVINNYNTQTTNTVVNGDSGGGAQAANQSRFKAWLSGVFARQSEQARLRDREYEKRESLLARAHNKVIRHIEGITKSIGDRLDPRRVGSTFGDQMKTLLFMLGFHKIATNWGTILKTVASIEEFFVGGIRADGKGKSKFSTSIIRFLGGNPEDPKTTVLGTLKDLFVGPTGVVELISRKFDLMMQERSDAMKAIKFPKVEGGLTNIGGTLKAVGNYLADILTAFTTGTRAIAHRAAREFSDSGSTDLYRRDTPWRRSSVSRTYTVGSHHAGDAAGIMGKEFLDESDVDGSGRLLNKKAGISLGNALNSMVNDSVTGSTHTAGFMTGIDMLERGVKHHGGVLVNPSSFSGERWEKLGFKFSDLKEGEDYKLGTYKYVAVKKEEAAKKREEAKRQIVDSTETLSKGSRNVLKAFQGVYGLADGAVELLSGKDTELELAPMNDPRAGVPIKINGRTETYFNLAELNEKGIKKLKEALMRSGNAKYTGENDKFDGYNRELQKVIESNLKGTRIGTKKSGLLNFGSRWSESDFTTDYDPKLYEEYDRLNTIHRQREIEHNAWVDQSQVGRFTSNVSNSIVDAVNFVMDKLGISGEYNLTIKQARDKNRANYEKALNFFMRRLGLTKEQAIGLLAHLVGESGLDPHAINSHSQAVGIGQWLGDRKKNLFRRYGVDDIKKLSLDQQLEFLAHEMETEKYRLNELKKATTAPEAAAAAFGYYGFSVGPEGAIAEMDKHGQNGRKSLAQKIRNAKDLSTLFEVNMPNNHELSASSLEPKKEIPVGDIKTKGDWATPPVNGEYKSKYSIDGFDINKSTFQTKEQEASVSAKISEMAKDIRLQTLTNQELAKSIYLLASTMASKSGSNVVINNTKNQAPSMTDSSQSQLTVG